MKAARATANAPSESRTPSCRSADDGVARAAGVVALVTTFDRPEIVHPIIDDGSDFEGRETYQDGIEDASMFSVADGDDDAMFVIDMKVRSGCQRCGCAFFARARCLQCGVRQL